MLIGQEPQRISTTTQTLLWGKGIHEEREDHTLVRIYGFKYKPFLLRKSMIDKKFVLKFVNSTTHG